MIATTHGNRDQRETGGTTGRLHIRPALAMQQTKVSLKHDPPKGVMTRHHTVRELGMRMTVPSNRDSLTDRIRRAPEENAMAESRLMPARRHKSLPCEDQSHSLTRLPLQSSYTGMGAW
jgi:hypothetical protein